MDQISGADTFSSCHKDTSPGYVFVVKMGNDRSYLKNNKTVQIILIRFCFFKIKNSESLQVSLCSFTTKESATHKSQWHFNDSDTAGHDKQQSVLTVNIINVIWREICWTAHYPVMTQAGAQHSKKLGWNPWFLDFLDYAGVDARYRFQRPVLYPHFAKILALTIKEYIIIIWHDHILVMYRWHSFCCCYFFLNKHSLA